MADYAIPKNGVAYVFYTGLVSQADTKLLKSGPTLASGDFKVSIDGGALANLTTLPTNTPGSQMVKISLSAAEMTGDNITVVCVDAAGAEWCDQLINIQTSARGIADLAYPATSGRSMVVDASGLVDANTVKIGPTGSGTAQTARDIGLSVLLSSGTGTGQVKLSSGYIAPNWGDVGNPTTTVALTGTTVGTLTTYTGNTPQTGDSFARIGSAGAGLTSLGDTRLANLDAAVSTRSTYAGGDTSGVTTLLSRLTSTRAGYLDNLSGGAVALASGVTVSDKTGFSLTQSFPANFAAMSITPGGVVSSALGATGLDSIVVETGVNARQALSLIGSAVAGTVSGAEGSTLTFKNMNGSTTRIVAAVDSSGNRTGLTLTIPT